MITRSYSHGCVLPTWGNHHTSQMGLLYQIRLWHWRMKQPCVRLPWYSTQPCCVSSAVPGGTGMGTFTRSLSCNKGSNHLLGCLLRLRAPHAASNPHRKWGSTPPNPHNKDLQQQNMWFSISRSHVDLSVILNAYFKKYLISLTISQHSRSLYCGINVWFSAANIYSTDLFCCFFHTYNSIAF